MFEKRLYSWSICALPMIFLLISGCQPGDSKGVEANKELVQRYFEEFLNNRNMKMADEIFTEDFVFHASQIADTSGVAARKQFVSELQSQFPDYQYSVEDVIAAEDRVAVRWKWSGTHKGTWNGIAPTGKLASCAGTAVFRISNGRFAEHWADWDMLGMLRTLGVDQIPGTDNAQ